MEKAESISKRERIFLPTIAAALSDTRDLAILKEYIGELDLEGRSAFLQGLHAAEKSLELYGDKGLDVKTTLKRFAPSAIGAAIGYVLLALLVPAAAASAAVAASAVGSGTAMGTQKLLEERRKRMETIGRLKELQRAIMSGEGEWDSDAAQGAQ